MKTFDVYTKNGCPWCEKAKALIQSKGFQYKEHVLGAPCTKEEIQARMASAGVNVPLRTVPQIFLNGESADQYIGGHDDLVKAFANGTV